MCLDFVINNLFGTRNDYAVLPGAAARQEGPSKVLSCARYFFLACTAVSGVAFLFTSHPVALIAGLISLGGTVISWLLPDSENAARASQVNRFAPYQPHVPVGCAWRAPQLPPPPVILAPPPEVVHIVHTPPPPPVYYRAPEPHAPLIFRPAVEVPPPPLPTIFAPPPPPQHVSVGRDTTPRQESPLPSLFGPPRARSHDDQVRVGGASRAPQEAPAVFSVLPPGPSIFGPPIPPSTPSNSGPRVRVGGATNIRPNEEEGQGSQSGDRVRVGGANQH